MRKVFLVEDSPDVQKIVLQCVGSLAEVLLVENLVQARAQISRHPLDLILLDLSLPDGNGLSFLAELKSQEDLKLVPIFILSGKHDVTEKLQAFQLGADDYITKPFNPLELRARIEARLKRESSRHEADRVLVRGNLKLDVSQQLATISRADGRSEVFLSSIEFKILSLFMRNPLHVLSRLQILEHVWGTGVSVVDRTVDTHVSHLRKKLGECDYTIQTVLGMGYSFKPH